MSAIRARERGLRTLQHQILPAAICYAIDTEVWLRTLVGQGPGGETDRRWATKDQVHDEALNWFLERHAREPVQAPPRASGGQDLTFWVDSKLMQRARRMAARDGIRLAQLLEVALLEYVAAHIPEPLLAFRRQSHEEARRLYRAHRQAAGSARGPPQLGPRSGKR